MITRFYVDNYKCLQNFEYKPKAFELVVGANGTGKSTVFEALDKVRRFVSGEGDAGDLFDKSDLCRWSTKEQISFEVDFDLHQDPVTYSLTLNWSYPQCRVQYEKLVRTDTGFILLESEWRTPEIIGAVGSAAYDEQGNVVTHLVRQFATATSDGWYPVSYPYQSALPFVAEPDPRNSLTSACFLKLNPPLMTSQVKRLAPRPTNDLSNFSSYYIYSLQQQQGQVFDMIPSLKETFDGFDSFAVAENFEEARRDLFVLFRSSENGRNAPVRFRFDELSDGQRALMGLYTLLFCTLNENTTIVIDEPENYVALRELQPWLMLLEERLEEYGGQVILISHHPEFINALTPQSSILFTREHNGPVRVGPFDAELFGTLAPAEVIARGWEV